MIYCDEEEEEDLLLQLLLVLLVPLPRGKAVDCSMANNVKSVWLLTSYPSGMKSGLRYCPLPWKSLTQHWEEAAVLRRAARMKRSVLLKPPE